MLDARLFEARTGFPVNTDAGIAAALAAQPSNRLPFAGTINFANDAAFGRIANEPELGDRLFVTSKIDREGADAGTAQFQATRRLYGRDTIDLVQIFSLTDLETHWPNLKEWKTSGFARYVGVTVAEERLHARLERFLETESPAEVIKALAAMLGRANRIPVRIVGSADEWARSVGLLKGREYSSRHILRAFGQLLEHGEGVRELRFDRPIPKEPCPYRRFGPAEGRHPCGTCRDCVPKLRWAWRRRKDGLPFLPTKKHGQSSSDRCSRGT